MKQLGVANGVNHGRYVDLMVHAKNKSEVMALMNQWMAEIRAWYETGRSKAGAHAA